jgi:hypothetical protein
MLRSESRVLLAVIPSIGPLGEVFGAYAVASTVVIPFALGVGLDERTASVVSIGTGVASVSLFLAWRYLPSLYRISSDHH